jgi:hypothetical protein
MGAFIAVNLAQTTTGAVLGVSTQAAPATAEHAVSADAKAGRRQHALPLLG